ncbi:Na+/H+ antiporter NhaC [Aquibacillus kalidii]|uniref:Na+/H+ antiporter NhaC n=1 Tax=Aquibacillus kalidii TaxID=2762597 RepID=UPI0016457F99|nr:Na+/H+ antiporter NhaC [Aquibacillus kalidii]
MFEIQPVYKPKVSEAIILIIGILSSIFVSIFYFSSAPHIPILLSILILMAYGLFRKVSINELENGLVDGAKSGIQAIFIFLLIGVLISSWLLSSTIPTVMYIGFELITPEYFYAIIFVLTAIIGVCVGSSLTTVATIGVAFIGIAEALDLSLAITAGAIVSGSFFGDKMSPLSDTTNLAASVVKVDLFEHIRNMSWTTVPAFLITFILFMIMSPSKVSTDFTKVIEMKEVLINSSSVQWNSLIPIILLFVLILFKIPAIFVLALSSLSAIILSFFHQEGLTIVKLLSVLFDGYVSETGNEAIDSLLSRGGMNSMMFTISLVLLALGMGGLLFKLGIIPAILEGIEHWLKTKSSVILACVFSAIGINVLAGEQYLSILLTGESFKSHFKRVGLANKNLSRALEDGGTVINPLVPWGVCGAFITTVLGVPTLEYLPFAFFCLLSPIITIILGFTGWTLTTTSK